MNSGLFLVEDKNRRRGRRLDQKYGQRLNQGEAQEVRERCRDRGGRACDPYAVRSVGHETPPGRAAGTRLG